MHHGLYGTPIMDNGTVPCWYTTCYVAGHQDTSMVQGYICLCHTLSCIKTGWHGPISIAMVGHMITTYHVGWHQNITPMQAGMGKSCLCRLPGQWHILQYFIPWYNLCNFSLGRDVVPIAPKIWLLECSIMDQILTKHYKDAYVDASFLFCCIISSSIL